MGSRYRPSRGLTELEPGLWLVRIRYRDERAARTRDVERRVRVATWEEAAEARETLARELRGGTSERPERTTLDAFVQSWLERRRPIVRPSTASTYADRLAWVCASLGQHYLDALTPGDVEGWMARQRGRAPAYSPATVNGALRVLRAVARDASRDTGCRDWTAGVRPLPEGATHGRRGTALDVEQFRALVTALEVSAKDPVPEATRGSSPRRGGERPSRKGGESAGRGGTYAAECGQPAATEQDGASRTMIAPDVARALLVLAWLGARAGEVLELRWTDWDREAGLLRVERAVWRGSVGATKTDDPRLVAVPSPLAAVLDAQEAWLRSGYVPPRSKTPGTHPGLWSGLVFPARPEDAEAGARRRGGAARWHRSVTVLAKGLESTRKAAGLPPISLHSLRRTWARLAREAGVSERVRRVLAGWRSPDAQAIYEDVPASQLREAGAALVTLVKGGER